MIEFKPFRTRREAEWYIRLTGRGSLCGEQGPKKADYEYCCYLGLMRGMYPYAVTWEV